MGRRGGADREHRPTAAAVVERFLARARAAGRRVAFFAVEERFLRASGLDSILIGEQPTWDPLAWDGTVQRAKSLREQLRRARAKGVAVRRVDAEAMADSGVAGAPRRRGADRALARVARDGADGVPGRCAAVRVRAGAPLLRRREGRAYRPLPRGGARSTRVAGGCSRISCATRPPRTGPPSWPSTSRCARWRKRGARYVTLGLAPLAGTSGWLRVAKEWTRALYDFEGVRAFKAKLRPNAWEPIYLAFPTGTSANAALFDALAAFARGSFARFGAETLLHGPAIVVRALAAMLVPWTILLATAPARWFPFSWSKGAWVAFDLALTIGLFALAARWRGWLGQGTRGRRHRGRGGDLGRDDRLEPPACLRGGRLGRRRGGMRRADRGRGDPVGSAGAPRVDARRGAGARSSHR